MNPSVRFRPGPVSNGVMVPAPLLAALDARDGAHADGAGRAAAATAAELVAEAPRLRRLVHRLLGWQARAGELDDVVQDVLLAAWRQRATFRGDAALATWLVRIALRTTHNHVRHTARRRRRFAGWFTLGDAEPTALPDPAAERDDTLAPLRTALAQLGHGDREVLVLRYLEQRDAAEVAALLDVTRNALDARLSRARARLRALLPTEELP